MSESALFLGRIRHRRLGSPVHEFDYPVWYVLVDLDELQELDRDLNFFSHNRFNLTGFDDRDHMGPEPKPVREKLETWLRQRGIESEIGRVQLLTHLRILGHVFNPVSFYFIRDAEERLRHAVAEVNNTFGETYCYLLDTDGSSVRHDGDKLFHVSPFQPVDGRYQFRINEPGKRMTAHIDVLRDGGRVFDTTLSVKRRDLAQQLVAQDRCPPPPSGSVDPDPDPLPGSSPVAQKGAFLFEARTPGRGMEDP